MQAQKQAASADTRQDTGTADHLARFSFLVFFFLTIDTENNLE